MAEATLGTVKVKMEGENESFCYGCLSSDRRLTVLSENTDLFVYLLGRTCVSEHTHIFLCWECSAILRNTRRFQQRIRRAQDLMQLQQTLYQQQSLQTLIDGDPIKLHSSLHTKIFDLDHYDLCIEHTDTLTDMYVYIADVEIKNENDDFDHEASLTSTINNTVIYSNTDTTQSNNDNLQDKFNYIESTVHGAAFKKQLIVLLERIDEKKNVEVKYENIYDSDIDIDEVDIEAGLKEQDECSAQDTNIEHQLNKHEDKLIKEGIDSNNCESNVSERSFSEQEMESSLDAGPPGKKLKPSDDNRTKREEKIEVINVKHVAEKHLKTGTKSKPYKCNYCEKTFISRSKLNLHFKTHTRSVKGFICETCDKTFKQRLNLIRHLRTHTGEKPYSCKSCDKKFTNHSNLKRHSRIHTCEKPYSCEICNIKFTYHSHFKSHSRIHTGEKHSCPLCDKKFTHLSGLKRHSRIHTGEKPFSCEICKKKFSQHIYLKCHFRIHTGEKPYSCEICDKKFIDNRNLKNHSRIHTGERPYSCEICDKKFTFLGNLKGHSRMHTGEKPHSCEICDKKFKDYSNLKKHSRIHTGEKPHSCEICDKKFKDYSNLKKHSRIHTGEKPHSCEICDKKFKDYSNLKKHSRIHTGETPYSCELCDKKFTFLGNLKGHSRMHTGEKPYSCEICDKKFKDHSNLKKHSRIHTGETPYSCDVCCKRFMVKCHLKRHLNTHNSDKPHSSVHAQL